MKTILAVLFLLLSVSTVADDAITPYLQQDTYLDMKISPDGKHIAAISFDGEEYAIIFLDAKSLDIVDVMKFRYPDTVGPFRWVNNERIVLNVFRYIYRMDGFFTVGELYSMKVNETRGKFIFGYRAGKDAFGNSKEQSIAAKHRNFSKAWNEVIDILEDDPQHILVAATPWSADSASNTHVYKINVEDGNIFPVTILNESYARIITDGAGNIVAAYRYNDNFETQTMLYDKEDDTWRIIEELNAVTDFDFQYFDAERNNLVFGSRFQSDKSKLYGINLGSKEVFELFAHPNVDVQRTLSASKDDIAYAVLTYDGKVQYTPINQNNPLTPLFAAMVNGFKDHRVNILNATKDRKKVIFTLESDTRAPEYYLFDADIGRPTLIAKANTSLSSQKHVAMLPFNVSRKDADDIPGYISLPSDLSKNVPVLVMFNHNPHTRRHVWGFDREAQMYAKQGFAVVQINLPGSDGYGRTYDEIGIAQWQKEQYEHLAEALTWIAKTYPVNVENVCLFGSGWGAYMATMATRYDATAYKCVVAENGYYDFGEYWEESFYERFTFGDALMSRDFGANEEALDAHNLERHIEAIKTPILFVHEEYANVQTLGSVEDLAESLNKNGVPSTVFEKQRTSRAKEALEVDVAAQKAIFDFLQQHLKKQ